MRSKGIYFNVCIYVYNHPTNPYLERIRYALLFYWVQMGAIDVELLLKSKQQNLGEKKIF